MNAIVVGTDGSAGAETAIRKIIELAQGRAQTAHLVCAYPAKSVLERLGMTAKTDPVDLRGVAIDVLARDERRFEDAGFQVELHAREGDPAEVLIDVAREQKADLIVVGARGESSGRHFMLGSVAGKLTHHAPSSLMIVRED